MAKTVSDEELQLRRRARRRLIGAIALIAAVVVILPMILDSEPQPAGQDIEIRIPSPDAAGAFTSKVAPPASAPAPDASQKTSEAAGVETRQQKAAAVTEPRVAATAAKEEAAPAAQQQVATTATKPPAPAVADKKAGAKPPAAAAEQFVVQVAALADAAKARQIQQKISDAGLKSYTEVVKTAKGDVTRVRAGPFATREAAEKVQKQLRTMGLDGKVVPKSR